MSLSFLTPTRTILLISDEFLSILTVGASGVNLIDTIPWEAENFESNVSSIIAKDCGNKPVLILNDMVEQHYRKERVIRTGVSVMDRSAMLKRKLNASFPNYSIRASYALKEKVQKTNSQPAADIYIFAALSDNTQTMQTINATKNSLASVAGLCLLPVESSDMVKALSVKLGGKNAQRKQNVWSVFIGQHRNGSLRQVLTKNGELALTRMSPIVDKDDNPEQWAEELHQELKSTMSYLSRFGYDPQDGLDVFVIANPAPGEALKNKVDEECDLHIMGVDEAAKALNVKIGNQENLRYADPLHVAWAGRKSRFILPMKALEVDRVSYPRKVAAIVGLGLFASAAFLFYQAFENGAALVESYSEIGSSQKQKVQLDSRYQREIQRLENLGFDAKLVQSSLTIYEEFEQDRIKVLQLFKNVGKALGKDLRIDSIELKKPQQSVVQNIWGVVNSEKKERLFEATLKMTYPSTANVDTGNQEVADLRDRIEGLLPLHEVKVTKFLKDYEYTEGLVVETGDLETQNIQQDFVSEILVRGPIKE